LQLFHLASAHHWVPPNTRRRQRCPAERLGARTRAAVMSWPSYRPGDERRSRADWLEFDVRQFAASRYSAPHRVDRKRVCY